MSFEKVKKDYLDVIRKWGHPSDMTGGFVDAEAMEKVILNPTKERAASYLIDVIQYGFQDMDECYNSEEHGKVHKSTCEILTRVYERYI